MHVPDRGRLPVARWRLEAPFGGNIPASSPSELFGSRDNRERHASNEVRKTGPSASGCAQRTPFERQMTAPPGISFGPAETVPGAPETLGDLEAPSTWEPASGSSATSRSRWGKNVGNRSAPATNERSVCDQCRQHRRRHGLGVGVGAKKIVDRKRSRRALLADSCDRDGVDPVLIDNRGEQSGRFAPGEKTVQVSDNGRVRLQHGVRPRRSAGGQIGEMSAAAE